ncbi:MAG: efflux RND transporter periplasmic adaptor subunit, partial [Veillonella sp.]|jgi:HlyD family secretion protein/macrolide-specific efflux system membrane fusion protein|nr:efflux RND transporter periplasmic adaptor subunit [Veillonella sp.]
MKEFLQKHRKRIVTGAVVLCVLGGGTYYYMDSLNANQAQTLYTTGKVEKGDVKTSISATGTINPVNYVDVSTNVAGKLEKVLVKENDQVTAGQVIAYIDTRQLQASVDDARAALAKAELDMNRYKSLAAQDAIAQQTYDDSVTSYERAKSTYERAAADLSDATITAPMSGTVVGTPLKAGQTISTGISTQMIIATIADLKN